MRHPVSTRRGLGQRCGGATPGAAVAWPAWLLLACAGAVQAHQASDAYLSWHVDGARIEQRIDIALRDLDRELALDADGDGLLSWGEVRRRWPDIERLAAQGVRVGADGQACVVQAPAAPQLEDHGDGRYAVLQQALRCPAPVRTLEVDYRLFARSDATHRGIARIDGGAPHGAARIDGSTPHGVARIDGSTPQGAARIDGSTPHGVVLVPGAGVQRLAVDAGTAPARRRFAGFVAEGVRHIAGGLDHILFLVSLLMVAVWRRTATGWVPRHGAASAWAETLRLVTAFTVAHSLTLALAAAGVLAPPSRWVESLIAASVLVAALDNLWPIVPGPRWIMVSVFGLVHGLGFAGPLQELGLRRGELLLPLLGFNLGVELGQLALVAVLLPLAIGLRGARWYRRAVVSGGSLAVAGLALVWMLERSLGLELLR